MCVTKSIFRLSVLLFWARFSFFCFFTSPASRVNVSNFLIYNQRRRRRQRRECKNKTLCSRVLRSGIFFENDRLKISKTSYSELDVKNWCDWPIHPKLQSNSFPRTMAKTESSWCKPLNLRPYFKSVREWARSQLGTRCKGKSFRNSFSARNELVPSLTKNTASGVILPIFLFLH